MEEEVRGALLDAAWWARFLALMSFIFIGLLMAMGIYLVVTMLSLLDSTGNAGSRYGFAAFIGFYFLLAIVYSYPTYALLKFGSLLKPALETADQDRFNTSMRYLRNLFRYIGILAIILLVASGGLLLLIVALYNGET